MRSLERPRWGESITYGSVWASSVDPGLSVASATGASGGGDGVRGRGTARRYLAGIGSGISDSDRGKREPGMVGNGVIAVVWGDGAVADGVDGGGTGFAGSVEYICLYIALPKSGNNMKTFFS